MLTCNHPLMPYCALVILLRMGSVGGKDVSIIVLYELLIMRIKTLGEGYLGLRSFA